MDLLLEEPIPASATTSQWTVENFQVPVPIGDCSIHVLIHYNGEEYVVEYAFIMDGGAEAGRLSPSDAINRTLEFVNRYLITEYHLPNDSRLRFNLWVVTHWDADHFYGVRALLLDDDQDWKGDNFVENPLLYCGKYVETVAKEFTNKGFHVKGGEVLIGHDLLSEEQIFNVYGERLSLRNPDEESRPRFCVMGANGYGVGKVQMQTDPNPNQTSILAVLFWPSRKGQCSYFTGGDGNPEVEREGIIPFLQKGSIANLGHGLDLMKLDHHGSSGENIYGGDLRKIKQAKKLKFSDLPICLFRPERILVTPGPKFGHPTFDVIHFLLDILGSSKGLSKNGRTKGKVYTTRSPYWATKENITTSDINPNHQKYLDEIHERDQRDKDDHTKPYLTLGMVAADGLNDLETNVKRAALLQKWEKRIREQVAIKRNKNTTKTQIGKIADEEAMELRHQGVVEDNQNDPDIVENQASAACDYSYIVYDEVMNIRFTAHEMWNLISDQRIVPEDTDPFFIIHFNWKDGEFNNIRWLDWNGNSRKGEYEPVPSVPPRFSERLQQLYRDKLGQSLKYWEEKQKPFLKKRKTLGFEDYEDLENDSFSRSTMDQFIDQSDYDQDNLGRLYDLLIEAPQTDIDSHQSLTSINVVDQNFTGFSGTQMRTLALRLFPGSGIREDEDWGDKDNDDEEDEEYEISEESEEGDGDYDDGGEEGDEIEEVKKIEEEVDDENAYKIFGDSVDIDLDWKIDVDLNILDDLYERYQAAWRESLPDKDPRKRRLKKKPNKKMEIETVGLEEENEDDDLGEEESVMEFEESKVNLNHGSARLDDESKAPAVLMEAIEEEAETAVQFIDPTIFRTSFNGEVPASIADLLFSAITYKPEPKPKKKRRTKAKEDRNIDDKKPRPGRRPRHTAEKTTKNPQKKGSKDKTGEAKNNTETVQKRSSKKIHKEGNGSDQLRRRRGRSTTKDTNASGLQKKLEYKKAAGAIVTGEKGTTKEIKGEDEGEKGPEKRTKRN